VVTWLSLMKSAEVPGSRDSPNCLSGNWGWIGSGILARATDPGKRLYCPTQAKRGLKWATPQLWNPLAVTVHPEQ